MGYGGFKKPKIVHVSADVRRIKAPKKSGMRPWNSSSILDAMGHCHPSPRPSPREGRGRAHYATARTTASPQLSSAAGQRGRGPGCTAIELTKSGGVWSPGFSRPSVRVINAHDHFDALTQCPVLPAEA